MITINDVLIKLSEIPGMAESIRDNLVGHDLAVEIDGKRYQIVSKKTNKDDELIKLKTEVWNLREALSSLEKVASSYVTGDGDDNLKRSLDKARRTLGN